jgi:hypothetical protein
VKYGQTFSGEEHERELVKAFLLPQRQERYLELLSKPRRRKDLTREFAHFKHLDPRWAVEITPRFQPKKDILRILREKGALETCYCLSEAEELDGKSMTLADGLDAIVGRQIGTFLSCLPGRLAYFEDEEQRCILERAKVR